MDTYDNLNSGLSEEELKQIRNIAPPDDIITSEVLQRLREGDHESYKKVYLHWRRPIHRFVFNLTGTEGDADDITQDIFAVLWNYREKIDPEKNIRSLLFLIARRIAYKSNQANRIRERYADSVWMDESDYFTSHDIVVEKEVQLLKQALLQRMTPQQRKIFEMSHDEGLTPEEIAERLGIKRETVYNQLSKARKTLRDAILFMLLVFMNLSPNDLETVSNSLL
ncbi:RNA polymerase sigma factor [Bacteroides sp. UBA939]|uniref:RNA polymerase sigma factor n=1 Tax=Bacteroides sp. UBA939 TaxID=1946092 RepID=UPI0025C47373|nr:sigma-70 family RNA polymerase sigma factor [Bacteroides sp. UBA939]